MVNIAMKYTEKGSNEAGKTPFDRDKAQNDENEVDFLEKQQ